MCVTTVYFFTIVHITAMRTIIDNNGIFLYPLAEQ